MEGVGAVGIYVVRDPGTFSCKRIRRSCLAKSSHGCPLLYACLQLQAICVCPLSDDEAAWINALPANVDAHVMEMSKGVIECDRVR